VSEDFQSEEWRPVPGFEKVEVSSLGRVRNTSSGKVLKPGTHYARHGKPYLKIDYFFKGLPRKNKRVHLLVCLAFHGPSPYEGAQVKHKDDDGLNNKEDNLSWGTHLDNQYEKQCGNCPEHHKYLEHGEDGQCAVLYCPCSGWKVRQRKEKERQNV